MKSVYFPVVLVPTLLSSSEPHIPPLLTAPYTGWVGYITTVLLLLGEVEIVLLVVLCALRYAGVRCQGDLNKSRRHITAILTLLTLAVLVRVATFLTSLSLSWSYKPLIFQRILQIVFTQNPEHKEIRRAFNVTRDTWTGVMMAASLLLSVLTVKYLRGTQGKNSIKSTSSATRTKRSILAITLMNYFNCILAFLAFTRLIDYTVNPDRKRYSTFYNTVDFAMVHAIPLAQSVFNPISFVWASSSFKRFVVRLYVRIFKANSGVVKESSISMARTAKS